MNSMTESEDQGRSTNDVRVRWYLTEALLRNRIGDGDELAPDEGALTLTGNRLLMRTGNGRSTHRGSKQGDRLEEDRGAGW